MSSEEEIVTEVTSLGNSIKALKSEKKPKDEWFPLVEKMNALKVRHTQL